MFDFIKELAKIDVEYNYEDSDDKKITFRSYVKSVESDYLLIDFLFYKGAEYNIPPGKLITVNFKEKSGIYSGNCYIIGRDNSKLSGFKITYPEDIQFIQQREYVRAPLKLKTEIVIFLGEDGNEENSIVYEEKTLDISGSGFCFISSKPIEKHSKIIGIVNLLDSDEEPIKVSLKHVYSRKLLLNGKEMYKNAFTFLDINEKVREKILKKIFLYELELRKKGI